LLRLGLWFLLWFGDHPIYPHHYCNATVRGSSLEDRSGQWCGWASWAALPSPRRPEALNGFKDVFPIIEKPS
jgi:hypothetical protein